MFDVLVRFLNPLLMIVVGLAAGALFVGRRPDSWRLYAVGAWTFILSQVFHIPFNIWVLNPRLDFRVQAGAGLFVSAVLVGLSAGVFEELARYLAFRYVIPKVRDWRAALCFGAGHGGVEAILVGSFALYTVLQLVALRGQDASALLRPDQLDQLARAQAQVAAFWALPWYGVLLGALERVFAICFHLSAAVLVLQVFRRRNLLWLLLAVLWHTALNASAVYVSVVWGPFWAELALGVLALLSIGIIFGLREPGRAAPPGAGPPVILELEPADVSDEQIEGSRFA